MEKNEQSITRRERLALTTAVLIPMVAESLGDVAKRAGRLMWLVPLIALPLGVLIGRSWARLGDREFSEGMEQAFGKRVGRWVKWLYLCWGVYLLGERARAYSMRLTVTAGSEGTRWLYFAVGFTLCLWLRGKGGRALARTGMMFFYGAAAVLGMVLVLCLPSIEPRNLLPLQGDEWRGLWGAAVETVSFAGYGVFALCLPMGREDTQGTRWTVFCCGGYTALNLAAVGTLGAGLTARWGEPFFRLSQGATFAGLRWEALAAAVLTLCDWAGLALLVFGCGRLWSELTGTARGFAAVVTAVFIIVGLFGESRAEPRSLTVWGNLCVGALIPLAAMAAWGRKRGRLNGTKYGDEKEKQNDI